MWQSSRFTLENQRSHLQRGLELNDSERLSFNFLLDGNKRPPNIPSLEEHTSPPHGGLSTTGTVHAGQVHDHWTTLPKHVPPTCTLDNILLKFLHSRQQEIASNRDHVVSNPAYPRVASLVNPRAGVQVDPLSQLMTDIISKFPAICGLPEQVATLYGMFVLMRWMVNPTQSNYARLPGFLIPQPSQLFTAHPAWIDYLPWPRMRDKLVSNYQEYPFENWFIPFTSELSINWPYEPTDCLLATSDGNEHVINPVFERHLTRLENWSVGATFIEAFPALADTVQVKTAPTFKSISQAT